MPVIPCAPSTPVFGIVTFDPATFRTSYPEFTGIDAGPLDQNFAIATLLLNNTCGSRVSDANQRLTLLDVLVAHLTFLSNGTNDGGSPPIIVPPPGVVGRIDSASEGAVSVSAQFEAPPNINTAYLSQTKYGALFLALTARYRTMLYVPAPGCNAGGFNGSTSGNCGC